MLSLGNKLTLTTQPIYKFVNKYSIDFDGVDDRIITDGADTVLQNTTYSFWSKSSTTGFNPVFGHGNYNIGGFSFNYDNTRPLLYLENNSFRYWDNTSKQDDGEWHHWVVYLDTDINNTKLYCDGVLQNVNATVSTGTPTAYTESLTIGATKVTGGSSFNGKIDEFAVYDRELTQAEITRMYNTYYSPNRVANGNFSQIGNEEVTNGDFSQIGSEEIVNGDFDTSIAIGTNGSGWSRFVNGDNTVEYGSGGVILTRGSNSSTNECKLYANTIAGSTNILTTGKNYKLTYTVVANTNVTALAYYVGGTYTNLSHNVGTHTLYFTQGSNQLSVFWNQTTSSSITIDNVSVKEVGQDWTVTGSDSTHYVEFLSTGARFVSDTVSPVLELKQNAITSGKQYVLTCNVAYTGAGQLRVNVGSNLTAFTEGANTRYFTATSGTMSFLRENANVDALLSNLSVKEVGQHWTFGSAWSTDGTKAIYDDSAINSITQTLSLFASKTYKIQFKVSNSSGSGARMKFGNAADSVVFFDYAYYTDGEHTLNYNATSNSTDFNIKGHTDGSSFDIDNIIVQELKHDATNLMLNAGDYQSANPLITSTKSMEFDGTDNYMVANSTLDSFTGSFSCWIFFDTTGNFGYLLDARKNSGTGYIHINDTTSPVSIVNSSGTVYVDGVATINITSGKWHHVVVTGIFLNITESIFFGSRHTEANYIHGKMTEVGLWDRTLTALEVASLYNQGMPTNLLVNRNNYQSGNPTVFNTKQVDFDGVDDHLKVTNAYGSFTGSVSFWVNRDNNTGYQYIFDARGSGSGTGFAYFDTGTDNLVVSSGTRYVDGVAATSVPTDGKWHNIIITGVTLDVDESIRYGTDYGIGNALDGKMSQIGLWNTTLTADEVSSLYNHGLPIDLTTDQAAYASSSNLVGYWRMGSGTLDTYPLIADQTNATLGSELVTNGDFATETDWTFTNVGFSAGAITFDASSDVIFQTITYTVGKTYKIVITKTGDATPRYRTGFSGSDATITNFPTSNIVYFTATSNSNRIQIYGTGGGDFVLNSVSVVEVQGNPAIMTNQISSDIENGSPYANIVQNGTFDTNSDWGFIGTAEISGGYGVFPDTTSSYIFQSNVVEASVKNYTLQYEVIESNGGTLRLSGGNSAFGTVGLDNTVGTHTIYLQSDGVKTNLQFFNASSFVGKIDNVTLAETNTGLQGYWKMGDGTNDAYPVIYDQTNPTLGSEEIVNGDFSSSDISMISGAGTRSVVNNELKIEESGASFSQVIYNGILDTSKIYKATFDLTIGTGFYEIYGTTQGIVILSSSGTYTYYLANTPRFYVGSNGAGDIWYMDNISVKEVNGNPATMTNMVEGNITNQYPLTKIRNYYRMGDGILDGYPIIQDQTSPNLAHIPTTNIITYSEDLSVLSKVSVGTASAPVTTSNYATAPDGTQTATRVVFNLNGGTSSGDRSILRQAIPSGSNYYFSIYVKSTDGTEQKILWHDGGEYNLTTVTNEWVRITYDGRPNSAYAGIALRGGEGVDSSDILAWGFQVEDQSQATAYIKSDGIAAVRKSSTTNLVTYSEDTSQWTDSGITYSVDYIISPDGTLNASKAIINDTITSSNTRPMTSVAVTSGTNYVFSVFGKADEFDMINLDFSNTAFSTVSVDYNLTNGTVTSFVGSPVSQGVEDYGNGWYRCYVVATAIATTTTALIIRLDDNPTGDGTSGLYLWGAQFEEQSQATAYIKSDGIAAVRKSSTTNLVPYSETGTYGSAPASSTNVIAPDGTNTAVVPVPSAGSNRYEYNIAANTYASGTVLAFSWYSKQISTPSQSYVGNLNNQAATNLTFGSTTKIETSSNGFDRFQIIYTITNGASLSTIRLYFGDVIGVGNSSVAYWGHQLEQQTQAETYAPTYGLPVTIDLFTENNYGTMTNMSASDIVEDTP